MLMVKHTKQSKLSTISLLLRGGLAFCFLYAAISALRSPGEWVAFVPHFLNNFMAAETTVKLLSVVQIVTAGWLLWGRYLRYAAGLALVLLLGIFVFNFNLLIITFRDLGLAFMAAALLYLDL